MAKSLVNAIQQLRTLVEQVEKAYSPEEDWLIVGIANGGIQLAEYIHNELKIKEELGILNPIFHRDDLGFNPIPKNFQPTQVPFEIEGRNILLVDDVFASGRTLRACLNELFDHGRPESVRFACLFSTCQRKLPYQPDFTGAELEIAPEEVLKVNLSHQPTVTCTYNIIKK